MSLYTGKNRLVIQIQDQDDSNKVKTELAYNDLSYETLVDMEEAISNALVALGKAGVEQLKTAKK
jgi:hypothetical protein